MSHSWSVFCGGGLARSFVDGLAPFSAGGLAPFSAGGLARFSVGGLAHFSAGGLAPVCGAAGRVAVQRQRSRQDSAVEPPRHGDTGREAGTAGAGRLGVKKLNMSEWLTAVRWPPRQGGICDATDGSSDPRLARIAC